MSERLFLSQNVRVEPAGFRQPTEPGAVAYPTYGTLLLAFHDYAQIPATETVYEALMFGQPGWPGGEPARPVGFGIQFGETRNGVEWWLTDGKGLEDSAAWTQTTEQRAVGDGTWLLGVRAPGRDVILTGHLLSVDNDPAALAGALNESAAALAVPPRTGWLIWEAPDGVTKRLPVGLSSAVKSKREGTYDATVQMALRGVDIGTPGAGVYLEAESPLVTQVVLQDTPILIPGMIPTPPIIRVRGPVEAGAVITLGEWVITLPGEVLEAQTITIDCRQRYVDVNGAPDRSVIDLNGWPLLPVGAVNVQATYTGGGMVTMEATGLW